MIVKKTVFKGFALLGLNLLLAIPGFDAFAPSVRPVLQLVLPTLVALQILLFLLPSRWMQRLSALPEHRHFGMGLYLVLVVLLNRIAVRGG
ncbi:MAG: hypothetical protein U1E27_09855 [Kiritimatiellia bacterium]|nr:hypothetical protein [Kiritimatiellia bacterium]